MTLPTFLGIGVPRGGTTWLHQQLARHHDIYMPTRRKEIRFFDRYFDKGFAWYESFFCEPEEREKYHAIGEISPQYLYCPACPERIAQSLPNVKLIVTLRHPVDRAYSQYGFAVQRRNYRGSFAEFIDARPTALDKGFYSEHVQNYLRYFPREQLLPLIFEEIFADVAKARRRVADFLDVDVDRFDETTVQAKVNASTVPSFGRASGAAVTIGRRLRRWKMEALVDMGRRAGVQRLLTRGSSLPALDEETRTALSARYAQELEELEGALDINLARWRE